MDGNQLKPKLIHIVAMDSNRCIGNGDNIPWHLPNDLAWFKSLTTGKTCIVGRVTYNTLPDKVKNDTKRTFIVLSKGDHGNDLDDVCQFTPVHPTTAHDTVAIIGGAEVYAQSLKYADELFITQVKLEVDGDKFYPPFDEFILKESSPWSEQNGIIYRFTRWVRA